VSHHFVAGHDEGTGRCDRRVQLPQRSRGGVPWIGKCFLSPLNDPSVKGLEIVQSHVDFTPHREVAGKSGPGEQLEGQRTDRSQIDRDIFSVRSIAPCGPTDKEPMFVEQLHGQSVEFWLCCVDDGRCIKFPFHALIEGQDVDLFEDRIQAQHRLFVSNFFELLERRGTYSLSRRIDCHQLRMSLFELLKFSKQVVVGRVRNFWTRFHIVEVIVSTNLIPQGRESGLNVRGSHGSS